MESPSTSAAALKLEIARLSGAINRHKTELTQHPATNRPRTNVYVNPSYRPTTRPTSVIRPAIPPKTTEPRDVVLGGVAFESSGRSLVRKDLPKPSKPVSSTVPSRFPPTEFARTSTGHLIKTNRTYKAKPSRGRGRAPGGRNMTLDNTRRPYQSKAALRRIKYSDKPCPRFTTTGACSRGLTCMYQHDPSKIAICWNFLHGTCPNSSDTCNLSHDPTPERTPPCMHFANNGRCTRVNCPYPHVRLGSRQGVCRDFAVLGYCDKGLDCDKQHVRECPDFAEKGTCITKGCKLPHVIRANRNRPTGSNAAPTVDSRKLVRDEHNVSSSNVDSDASDRNLPAVTAEDGQIGDEFISLTFNESDSSDVDDEEDSEEEEEGEPGIENGDNPVLQDHDEDTI